jgi:hypothetical protein
MSTSDPPGAVVSGDPDDDADAVAVLDEAEDPEVAVREALAEDRRGELRAFEDFDLTTYMKAAEARRRPLTPEERQARAEARCRVRRQAARALVGTLAPEWFEDLVARRGESFLRSPDGALLAHLVGLNFGEDRAPALRQLTTLLLGRRVPPLVALLLVETWAARFCGPVPSEGEIIALVAAVVEERRR